YFPHFYGMEQYRLKKSLIDLLLLMMLENNCSSILKYDLGVNLSL
ncbi:MAG: hypothetical protein ACI9UT_000755, partial [Flavobacteriales bacterium]